MSSNTPDKTVWFKSPEPVDELWTCPFPDRNGDYVQCEYRGGVPAVEPGSPRSMSCIPCMINKVKKAIEEITYT